MINRQYIWILRTHWHGPGLPSFHQRRVTSILAIWQPLMSCLIPLVLIPIGLCIGKPCEEPIFRLFPSKVETHNSHPWILFLFFYGSSVMKWSPTSTRGKKKVYKDSYAYNNSILFGCGFQLPSPNYKNGRILGFSSCPAFLNTEWEK